MVEIAFCFLLLLLPTYNAQYTTIPLLTGVWDDDYRTTSSATTPGWERHDKGIVVGTTYWYHGTFNGDGIMPTSSREAYYITRQFYCSTFDSSVDITYTVYHCNCDGSDYVRLFINDNSAAAVTTYASSGTSWSDSGLPSCTFYSIPVGPISIPLVTVNNLFKLNFQISPSRNGEYFELSNIRITCHPLTDPPTTAIPTVNPTYFPTYYPTHFPTNYPTYYPTNYPTRFPTAYPSNQPTSSPTTFTPTMHPTKYPTSHPTPNPTPNDQQIYSLDEITTTDISDSDKPLISSNNNLFNSVLFYCLIGAITCITFIFCICCFIRKKQKQHSRISKNISTDYKDTKIVPMVEMNNQRIRSFSDEDEAVMIGIDETVQHMAENTQIAQQIQSVVNDFNVGVVNNFNVNVGVVNNLITAGAINNDSECRSEEETEEEDEKSAVIAQQIQSAMSDFNVTVGPIMNSQNDVVISGDDEEQGTETGDSEGNDDIMAGLQTIGRIDDETPPAPPPPPPPPPILE